MSYQKIECLKTVIGSYKITQNLYLDVVLETEKDEEDGEITHTFIAYIYNPAYGVRMQLFAIYAEQVGYNPDRFLDKLYKLFDWNQVFCQFMELVEGER